MSPVQQLIMLKIKENSHMGFECILLLMASTVFLHFVSFVVRTEIIFPFALKRARKVDKESLGEILGTKTRLIFFAPFFERCYHSAIKCSGGRRKPKKAVCKIVWLAACFVLFLKSCEQLIRQWIRLDLTRMK